MLKRPTSLAIHGDSLYIGSTGDKSELREYDLITGQLIQGTVLPGVESNYLTTPVLHPEVPLKRIQVLAAN